MILDRTSWYTSLRENYQSRYPVETNALGTNGLRLLFQVELGLFLLESVRLKDEPNLDFGDEPISVLWAVLSGLPFPRLRKVTEDCRRAIAIARFLLPFGGRFAWHEALVRYAAMPEDIRAYRVVSKEYLAFDEQVVDAVIKSPDDYRLCRSVYRDILSAPLQWREKSRPLAKAGRVTFDVHLRQSMQRVRQSASVIIPDDLIQQEHVRRPTFAQHPQRFPLTITHEDLQKTAVELDKRNGTAGWSHRLQKHIHYHAFENGRLTPANTMGLTIEGFTHVVGMVGSGKSTLMKLVAATICLFHEKRTITLVVGDTMTVFNLVDELNALLAVNALPVAVPLVGRSTREQHLRRFYAGDTSQSQWTERWLHTACPLMGLIPVEQIINMEGTPIPGREPCSSLKAETDSGGEAERLCPLFYACPSQRIWDDISNARIYVTTPGAMAKSRVPMQVDRRNPYYGEWLYEQSDIMVFDEVDTVIEWFDNEYASVIDLWGPSSAIFNRIDPAAATALSTRLSQDQEHWVRGARSATSAIVNILRQLSDGDTSNLRRWIGGRYFTAFNLFTKLAKRLLGIWDYTPEQDIVPEAVPYLRLLLDCFDQMTEDDPIMMRRPKNNNTIDEFAYRLSRLMAQALANGANSIISECETWLSDFIEQHDIDFVQSLELLNRELKRRNHPQESLHTLAVKLALALNVALLDRNLRIVFYQWFHMPYQVEQELGAELYRPTAAALIDALPIPPTGRVFGTYYVRTDTSIDTDSVLARFEYTSIGRWYLLHYHELLSVLDLPGPHILALSGTSWLPDSTRWHVDIPPTGILGVSNNDGAAPGFDPVRDESRFYFCPQKDEQGNLINVSGEPDKLTAIRTLTSAILRENLLEKELENLEKLAADQPEWWSDRTRLLLLTNSYQQAQVVATMIARHWTGIEDEVLYLMREGEAGAEELHLASGIIRGDIEKFATTRGKILVAPMNAIGRGYNILNREETNPKAAFGAVFFLVRPMPHPYDVQALAGELNARTLAWCEDDAFDAWQHPQLITQANALRNHARNYWAKAEMRRYYRDLEPDERHDLAATTLGRLIQAAGRLVRGGVPFHAFFVDAKWAPTSAVQYPDFSPQLDEETPEKSLLKQIMVLLSEYVDESTIGEHLYRSFEGLLDILPFQPRGDTK